MSKIIERAPKLRFPEFSGSWKLKRLGDYLQPYVERVPAPTDLPVYSSTREGLKPQNEYYNNRELANEGEYGVVPPGYFVYRHMSDDSTFKFNINKLETPLAVSKEYPVFTTQDLDSDFLLLKLNNGKDFKKYAAIQKMGGTRTRLYYKNLATWNVVLPQIDEQEKLASLLNTFNLRLKEEKNKLKLLYSFEKNILKKIFSQEFSFKSNSEVKSWNILPLKKLAQLVKEKNRNGNLSIVLTNSATQGVVPQQDYFNKDIANSNNLDGYYVVKKGDYVYNPRISVSAPVGPINRNHLATGLMSPLYSIFRFHEENNDFYELYFRSSLWHSHMKKVANYGVRHDRMNISNADFMNLPIPVPTPEEQNKIVQYFAVLERKILVTKQKVEKLERFKQGLLQQMFV